MSQTVNNSTRALAQTGAQIQKMLVALPATIDAQLASIQENENTLADQGNLIAANTRSIETQVREAGAEIRLQVKEDRDSVLSDLLGEFGLTAVKPVELSALKQRADEAEQALEKAEWTAVKGAVAQAQAKAESDLKDVKASHAVAIAQLNADAKSDETTIALLKGQIDQLQRTIDANREAEITKAEHASKAAGVVVNAGK